MNESGFANFDRFMFLIFFLMTAVMVIGSASGMHDRFDALEAQIEEMHP